jgi:rhodanese-related sulfurtransferase
MNTFWWWPFGRVPEVSAEQLYRSLKDATVAPQILDVRTGMEWSTNRIAGAINIPITELKARLATLPLDKERPVVAICRSAHRSIPAVRLLRANGYRQVCQLQGGMRMWWQAGLSVEGKETGASTAGATGKLKE